MNALTVDLSSIIDLSDDEFYKLCTSNKNVKIERTSEGELIFMPPTGFLTGNINSHINRILSNWNEKFKKGTVCDSSTGFILPNKAMRSPDAAWISNERLKNFTEEEKKKFLRLCPDFVIELMSESDWLPVCQDKMIEWMKNGCRLAWLIDPEHEKVYIYRKGGSISVVESFDEVIKGENVLEGFEFNLKELKG